MTRAQRFFTGAAVVSTIWLLMILDVLPLPLVSPEAKQEILPAVSIIRQRFAHSCALLTPPGPRSQLPWWVLVSTGSYLLFQIGWGLWNFNDVPKAYDDLMIVSALM